MMCLVTSPKAQSCQSQLSATYVVGTMVTFFNFFSIFSNFFSETNLVIWSVVFRSLVWRVVDPTGVVCTAPFHFTANLVTCKELMRNACALKRRIHSNLIMSEEGLFEDALFHVIRPCFVQGLCNLRIEYHKSHVKTFVPMLEGHHPSRRFCESFESLKDSRSTRDSITIKAESGFERAELKDLWTDPFVIMRPLAAVGVFWIRDLWSRLEVLHE